MSFKLNLSKAYDRMEWVFLKAMLLRLGFDENWVELIMQCVSTIRYAFLINGKPCGSLTPKRGPRQGDPLSPYLFLLCAEVFSSLLDEKINQNMLQGVRVCEGAPVISHLLFVDDSFYLGRPQLMSVCTSSRCFLIMRKRLVNRSVLIRAVLFSVRR